MTDPAGGRRRGGPARPRLPRRRRRARVSAPRQHAGLAPRRRARRSTTPGRIAWIGAVRRPARRRTPTLPVTRADFVLPGFVDTHLHYPQTHRARRVRRRAAAAVAATTASSRPRRGWPTPRSAAATAADFVRPPGRGRHHGRPGLRLGLPCRAGRPVRRATRRGRAAAGQRPRRADGRPAVRGSAADRRGRGARPGAPTRSTAGTAVADTRRPGHGPAPGGGRAALRPVGHRGRRCTASASSTPSVRDRGVYVHTHLSENDRARRRRGRRGAGRCTGSRDYLDTYDGRFRPGSQVGGESLLGPAQHLRPRRALHRRRARPAGRDAELDRPLPHLAAVPRLGDHALAAHHRGGRDGRPRAPTSAPATSGWSPACSTTPTRSTCPSRARPAWRCTRPSCSTPGPWPGRRRWTRTRRFGNFDVGKDADLVLRRRLGTAAPRGYPRRRGTDGCRGSLGRGHALRPVDGAPGTRRHRGLRPRPRDYFGSSTVNSCPGGP